MAKITRGDIVEVVYENNVSFAFLYVVLNVDKRKGIYCINKHHSSWVTTTSNSWNPNLKGGRIKRVARAYDRSKEALISLSIKLSASGADNHT